MSTPPWNTPPLHSARTSCDEVLGREFASSAGPRSTAGILLLRRQREVQASVRGGRFTTRYRCPSHPRVRQGHQRCGNREGEQYRPILKSHFSLVLNVLAFDTAGRDRFSVPILLDEPAILLDSQLFSPLAVVLLRIRGRHHQPPLQDQGTPINAQYPRQRVRALAKGLTEEISGRTTPSPFRPA